jgi:hypothetical protein
LLGRYQFSNGQERNDVGIEITISRDERGYVLGFQAAHPDAHGAAPDGEGVGRIGPDGVFRFTYEDSFSNRGTGTFRHGPRGYELSIQITEVVDPRCMAFYDDFTFERVRSKTQDDER